MNNISPHQLLRELKEFLFQHRDKINEQKNLTAKKQDFETATLYRELEAKLNKFIIELEFQTPDTNEPDLNS